MTDLAEQLVAEEEGRDPCVYPDTKGLSTIGIGALVDRRVPGAGLCDAAISAQFAHNSVTARADAANLPNFARCNDVQKAVLVSMCFQLGNLHDWPDFRKALAAFDIPAAVQAGMDSVWYRDHDNGSPKRAKRELQMLASGQWVKHA
jgi:GH24 family phage-related lysozyme (muramidase)